LRLGVFFSRFFFVERINKKKEKNYLLSSLTDPEPGPELGRLVHQPRQGVAPDRDHAVAAVVEGRGDGRGRGARASVAAAVAPIALFAVASFLPRASTTATAATAPEALPATGLVPGRVLVQRGLESRGTEPGGDASGRGLPAPPLERGGRGGDEAEVDEIERGLGGLGRPARHP